MAELTEGGSAMSVRLELPGHGDISVVNAWRSGRGLEPVRLRWQCQHSCAEADIPNCQDPDCDASEMLGDAERAAIFGMVEAFDLGGYAVDVEARVIASSGALDRMRIGVPDVREIAGVCRASLLSLALWSSGPPESDVDAEQLRELMGDTLRESFWYSARALMDQRFVSLAGAEASGDFLVFVARRSFPASAYVAFGSGPDTSSFNRAFGLRPSRPGRPVLFDEHRAGATGLPGELYGPRRRLVVRLEPALAERLLAASASWTEERPGTQGAGDRCASYFTWVAQELGLGTPVIPPHEGEPCAAPSAFLAALLATLPNPAWRARTAPPSSARLGSG